MAKRLVMFGCRRTMEGQWLRPRGTERSAVVSGMGRGDSVRLEVRTTDGEDLNLSLVDGANPLDPTRWHEFRVVKEAGETTEPTTVELEL